MTILVENLQSRNPTEIAKEGWYFIPLKAWRLQQSEHV